MRTAPRSCPPIRELVVLHSGRTPWFTHQLAPSVLIRYVGRGSDTFAFQWCEKLDVGYGIGLHHSSH